MLCYCQLEYHRSSVQVEIRNLWCSSVSYMDQGRGEFYTGPEHALLLMEWKTKVIMQRQEDLSIEAGQRCVGSELVSDQTSGASVMLWKFCLVYKTCCYVTNYDVIWKSRVHVMVRKVDSVAQLFFHFQTLLLTQQTHVELLVSCRASDTKQWLQTSVVTNVSSRQIHLPLSWNELLLCCCLKVAESDCSIDQT